MVALQLAWRCHGKAALRGSPTETVATKLQDVSHASLATHEGRCR